MPALSVVRKQDDLHRVRVAWRARADTGVVDSVGAILGIEGAHWLADGDPDPEEIARRLRVLYKAGFRVLALTHRFHNGLGHSSEGCPSADDGLSPIGEMVVDEAVKAHWTIDIAHASARTAEEILDRVDGPVVMSHGGPQGHCRRYHKDNPDDQEACSIDRGVSDELLRRVARQGGVIGIGFWPEAVGRGSDNIVRAIEYTIDTLSEDPTIADPCRHVAFGSDFDGAVAVPFDVAGLPDLTARLRSRVGRSAAARCFTDDRLPGLAGDNVYDLFARTLPTHAQMRAVLAGRN